jgi:hypothetical protein
MSRKSKLILATALFGAALFGASCGGGDSGGTTAGTGTGGGGGGGGGGTPPSPPPATVEGRVLAMLNVGGASAGPLNPVAICELRSDGKAHCGSDLNPSENVDLNYLHEFDNGNVVLSGTGDVLYFFNAQNNTLTKLTTFREVGGTTDQTVATGITIPTGANDYILRSDFVIIRNAANDIVVVTNQGRVIRDSNTTVPERACPIVNKAGNNFRLSTDGTSTSVTNVPILRAQAGGMFLVQEGNSLYLTSDRCTTSGAVLIDIIPGFNAAKMRQVGGEFRIAVRHGGNNLNYYRVSGTTVTRLRGPAPSLSGPAIALPTSANELFYDIDGNGYLYAITAANQVTVHDANGSQLGAPVNLPTSANAAGLLAFADRVLVRDIGNNQVHSIDETRTMIANVGIDFNAVGGCAGANTIATNGVGTNFIRCVFDGPAGLILYSITWNGAVYGSDSSQIHNVATGVTANQIRFGVDRVLVTNPLTNNIRLCITTNTTPPSISCSTTNLPSVNPADLTDPINTNRFLKSHGNNVFYARDRAGALVNPPRVGNIFGPPSALSMPVNNPSGGNASFDLTKFAFSFQPPTAPAGCNTHIAYLSSPTATPKLYALPSGSCVTRILKTFP